MSVAGQWETLGSELPDGWGRAELRLELRDAGRAAEAAALLGPAQPYRVSATVLRFDSSRDGTASSPDGVARLLKRLDDAGIGGTLALAGSDKAVVRAGPDVTTLAESWQRALAGLPPDWSDQLCELQLLSTDYIEPAAVLCIQMNPRRDGKRSALRFRVARLAGYGVSPQMAQRCLERCDAAGIRGSISVIQVLSDTRLAATQGPVWRMSGNTV
jgi:hypothetical protein